ncbi:MAG: fimbria/pilus periplasmic chaperone [Ghiorsea sp.]|nr:fimbria/pilus periplasmic chaperone [Ghiorsea sp.]
MFKLFLITLMMLAWAKPAFSLSVDSMVKIVQGDSRGVTFTIQGSTQERTIEAECFVVTMDKSGKEFQQACGNDYVIYPAIFSLKSEQKRAVRISKLTTHREEEVALRIYFRELPSFSPVQGVELLSRLGCWLFFQPKQAVIDVTASWHENGLRIHNQSNVHLRPISGKLITNHGDIDITETLKHAPRILAKHTRLLSFTEGVKKHIKHDTLIQKVVISLASAHTLHLSLP